MRPPYADGLNLLAGGTSSSDVDPMVVINKRIAFDQFFNVSFVNALGSHLLDLLTVKVSDVYDKTFNGWEIPHMFFGSLTNVPINIDHMVCSVIHRNKVWSWKFLYRNGSVCGELVVHIDTQGKVIGWSDSFADHGNVGMLIVVLLDWARKMERIALAKLPGMEKVVQLEDELNKIVTETNALRSASN